MHAKTGKDDPQKQLYSMYGGDGIADLIVGAAFMGIGLMLLSELPFVPVWMVVLLAPISWALKKWITLPRLEREEAEAYAQRGQPTAAVKTAALFFGLLLFCLLLIAALFRMLLGEIPSPVLSWGMIGFSLAAMLAFVGLLTRAWRYAFYALLVIPFMALTAGGIIEFPQAMAGLGAFIFLGGLVYAYRFVATHPRLAK